MLATSEQWLKQSIYGPKLPWKKGEIDAFETAPAEINKFTTPIFIVPPAGAFDHDEQRILSPTDHIRAFGPKLLRARQNRPVFVDALNLDDARHQAAFNVHPLTALLERARLGHAQAWPVTSYGRSDDYQQAVAKARLLNDAPVGMQITLADLGAASLDLRLRSLCNQVSCDPKDAVLIIDCGPLYLADEEKEKEFTEYLIQAINMLPRIHEWCQIVLTATSLGDLQKIKPNQQKLIRRSEWHIYQELHSRRQELLRIPIFGDYGVEYNSNLAPIKAQPSAKISYTTESGQFFVKGQNVKTGGYEAIFPVAETVVKSPHFMGRDYSIGDARMWLLSEQRGGTGNAPTWRWACAAHHLAVVEKTLAATLGMSMAPKLEPAPQQDDLFSLAPAK